MISSPSQINTYSFPLEPGFLLYNKTGSRLYHEVIKSLPVIDPHNHVDPADLAVNRRFENLYQIWIKPDQYKNRIMRNLGVAERLITGDADDYEKFMAWAACFPQTAGNPMFHWSCMELQFLFGFDAVLSPDNAAILWQQAADRLQEEGFGALDIVRKFNVETLCTSDDLLDKLEHHSEVNKQQNEVKCLPSLRGDSILAFTHSTFPDWLKKLQLLTGFEVVDLSSYKEALIRRMEFFDRAGCLLSDHSLDSGFQFIPTGETDAGQIFQKFLTGGMLSSIENVQLQSHLLHFLGASYAGFKWKMQLHIGAQRFTSSRIRRVAGPAGGYACIGNTVNVSSLCAFLDGLDVEERLPKTILYTLNPADNPVFATITGSFTEEGVKGKVQFGPAWWFNDHYEGIMQHLNTLAAYGLLPISIGMTTDSRSLLSFLRHDYYRRILCNLIGSWAEEKKLPDDMDFLSKLVSDIAYSNCKNWLTKNHE